jgi:hypothetical protein
MSHPKPTRRNRPKSITAEKTRPNRPKSTTAEKSHLNRPEFTKGEGKRLDRRLKRDNLLPRFSVAVQSLVDHRVVGWCKYSIQSIVHIVFFAARSGFDTWYGMRQWAERNFANLQTILKNLKGFPTQDTFARVVGKLDPSRLEKVPLEIG